MRKTALILTVLVCATNAHATPQTDRAAAIHEMTNLPVMPNGVPQSRVVIDGCDITILSYSAEQSTATFTATVTDGSLDTADVTRSSSGGFSDYIERDGMGRVGMIGFQFPDGLTMTFYADLAGALPLDDIRARPSVTAPQMDQWMLLLRDPPDATYVETLAGLIIDYQRDFCTPAS